MSDWKGIEAEADEWMCGHVGGLGLDDLQELLRRAMAHGVRHALECETNWSHATIDSFAEPIERGEVEV